MSCEWCTDGFVATVQAPSGLAACPWCNPDGRTARCGPRVDDAEVLEELPATTREVAARLDARASAVGMRLRRMRERGLVRYVRGGGRVVWEAVG